jgi:urea ABC transporter permease protein UrtC/urea ABC transporter ATP-binding protein UrtD
VALFGKYLCFALLALSIDLIWGYAGILSLGQGAFFALGGYAMGMYLMRQIGTRGVYANPVLPDFMVFLNWPELPIYWYGFQHFAYAAFMVLFVPGLLAFVFGWFAFRSRVTGVYLSIITQALTFALMLGFFRNNFGFGGNNGLTDFKDILGFNVQAPWTRAALFMASAFALIVGFVICRVIVSSKFGKVLVAIRDAEARTRFLGYRVEAYKLFVFTLSACMAGVAGALYVPQVGIINPSEFSPGNSIEAVIWVAVGGRGTLTGAVLGACPGELRQDLFHQRLSRALLALPARRSFRRRDLAAAARHRRHDLSLVGRNGASAARPPAPRPEAVRAPTRRRVRRSDRWIPRTTTALLYLDGVTVSFDGFRALNNLSFTIEPGEMRAIIGPNGAGKTTMMDVVTGKTRPDTGDVYFDGSYDLSRLDETEIALLGIGRKFQKPTVFDMHTVEDNIGLALKGDRRARKTLFWRETAEEGVRIDRILEIIRLSAVRHRIAGSLAHGQKQWLEIGMLLAQEPKLLLVDEPVAGMTDAETRQTAELLKEINRDRTVVVVEHDMTFVRELGVKVTCLHEGSVLAEGTIDQVSENERVVEVYLGR